MARRSDIDCRESTGKYETRTPRRVAIIGEEAKVMGPALQTAAMQRQSTLATSEFRSNSSSPRCSCFLRRGLSPARPGPNFSSATPTSQAREWPVPPYYLDCEPTAIDFEHDATMTFKQLSALEPFLERDESGATSSIV
jgi:hypothetical protein